ncbi:MAG: HD domain-containing protein [Bacteroidaceae bacterium]
MELVNWKEIVDKYYSQNSEQRKVLVIHSRNVMQKALDIVDRHPELKADRNFIISASMLHDLGIFLTDAAGIYCYGRYPYLCHGYLGADLLRKEGFPQHALVCERHTGAGISLQKILLENLPIPHRDMIPVSIEEQIICFADKFYSKSHLTVEKSVEKARMSIAKYGEDGLNRFNIWCDRFL